MRSLYQNALFLPISVKNCSALWRTVRILNPFGKGVRRANIVSGCLATEYVSSRSRRIRKTGEANIGIERVYDLLATTNVLDFVYEKVLEVTIDKPRLDRSLKLVGHLDGSVATFAEVEIDDFSAAPFSSSSSMMAAMKRGFPNRRTPVMVFAVKRADSLQVPLSAKQLNSETPPS